MKIGGYRGRSRGRDRRQLTERTHDDEEADRLRGSGNCRQEVRDEMPTLRGGEGKVLRWSRLLSAIGPYYPKGKRGSPPIGLERTLRIYFR